MASTNPGAATLAAIVVLLGGWIGAMVFFAAVMAPAAFAVLGGPAQAGLLVSRTLGPLNLFGAAAGLGLAWLARQAGVARWLQALAVLLGGLCIASHFGVSAELAEIRGTPEWREDPALATRFGRLHGLSVGLLGLTASGALVLLAGFTRALGRSR